MRPAKKIGKRPARKRTVQPRQKDYLAERTYKRLREKIYTGGYRPGEHLKEEVLVVEFGASRSVIRQALTFLRVRDIDVMNRRDLFFWARFLQYVIP